MTSEEIHIYREAFKQHLAKSSYRAPAEQDVWALYIETKLEDFVRRHYNPEMDSIYSQADIRKFNDILRNWPLNDVIQAEDEAEGGKIIKSIKIYKAFLESKWHPLRAKGKASLGKGETIAKKEPKTKSHAKPVIKLVEGDVLQERDREIHKRNPKLRQLCIEAYDNKYECVVCGMNFVKRYGEIGKEFIEVHHLNPISETDGVHEVDPATELIPLCSNCHSMIHRMENPAEWEKLKEMYNLANEQNS